MSQLFPLELTSTLDRFCYLVLLLLIYSFLGWCGEMVYCSIGQRKLCEKRGFLNGPLCPIYGHGALLVLAALGGGCADPIMTFFLGGILTSAVEYATSWAMEKLFHMRWWDYSNHPFNLHGRVCLLNSTLFGLASVALCHWVAPAVSGWVMRLFAWGIAVPLALTLAVVYLADIVLSVRSAIQISTRLAKLHAIHQELAEKLAQLRQEQRENAQQRLQHLEDQLSSAREASQQRENQLALRRKELRQEAQEKLRALYEKQDIFERRLLHSYPTLRSLRHGDALNKLREYRASRKKSQKKGK